MIVAYEMMQRESIRALLKVMSWKLSETHQKRAENLQSTRLNQKIKTSGHKNLKFQIQNRMRFASVRIEDVTSRRLAFRELRILSIYGQHTAKSSLKLTSKKRAMRNSHH